ncbi:hypothetical protein V7S43_010013 [Phytophthora oleae]|uniref:Crinkler effector protein N-terminal domain-containing protein n=1 Tax=Phytophthora oleae TaxID=2107226 RepID=A0ABD3FD26_9STRA
MAEMELECAVYGEGTVFPVNIARNAKVNALQKAIANEKKDVNDRFKVDPAALTLYLARKKEGEEIKWLKDDRHVKDFLRGGISAEYEEMRPTWKLNKKELFSPDFQPGEEQIHVLVELPKAATKRKRYVHSDMSSNKGNALLQDLNIRLKPVGTVALTAGDSAPVQVQAFEWESVCDGSGQNIALSEEQQRDRYRDYVEYNIGDVLTAKELCVLGVEKSKNILSVAVPGHDIDLVGRTDILVLSALAEQFPHYVELLPEVKMLIEVKRVMNTGCSFQALLELIALDFLVDDHY